MRSDEENGGGGQQMQMYLSKLLNWYSSWQSSLAIIMTLKVFIVNMSEATLICIAVVAVETQITEESLQILRSEV